MTLKEIGNTHSQEIGGRLTVGTLEAKINKELLRIVYTPKVDLTTIVQYGDLIEQLRGS